MLRSLVSGMLLALAVSVACAQSPAPATSADTQSKSPAAAPANSPVIPVELAKSLDSKKLKPGDEVIAQTTADMKAADGSAIPHGSKVVGHVTQATARSNGNPDSTLSINFEKVVVKGGKEYPLQAVLQAAAPPRYNDAGRPNAPGGSYSPGSSRQQPIDGRGQIDQSGAGRQDPAQAQAGQVPGQTDTGGSENGAQPALTAQSTGLIGFNGLQMGADGVIHSNGKNVKLESGTRMVLRVQSQ